MLEAQQVIALRLAKLARGGPAARKEAHRMVAEKIAASIRAAQIVSAAAARGRAQDGTDAALRLVRRRVRANRKRLSK
ncbi:MAG: hypothetical protein JOZ05_05125 [Acetobacteraceae bacterium]|nr:hypothetical protein [Acetobacteraceae bacterium]